MSPSTQVLLLVMKRRCRALLLLVTSFTLNTERQARGPAPRCSNIMSVSLPVSVGAAFYHCHRLDMSPHAGEGLVPVSAERRVTSGEQSEPRL